MTPWHLEGQPERLALAFLAGCALTLWLDMAGGLVRGFRLRGVGLHLLDVVALAVGGAGLLAVLWAGIDLEFRFYALAGVLGGALFYAAFGAPLLTPAFTLPASAAARAGRSLRRVLAGTWGRRRRSA